MIDSTARGAWRDLEAQLRPFVARRVRSAADVDDIVQDVFLRMQRGLSTLRDEERFGPWVYRVARSAIAEHQRARRRHPLATTPVRPDDSPEPSSADVSELAALGPPDAPDAPHAPDGADGDVGEAERELAMYIAAFIALFPSPYREALTLTELQGLTQREAAEMVGVSLAGMKSRVQRGRQLLREVIEACCIIALDGRGQVISCEPRPHGRIPDRGCTFDQPPAGESACTSNDGRRH